MNSLAIFFRYQIVIVSCHFISQSVIFWLKQINQDWKQSDLTNSLTYNTVVWLYNTVVGQIILHFTGHKFNSTGFYMRK